MLDWPIREVLLAYEDRLFDAQVEKFRHDSLIYVLGGSADKEPPEVPFLLRDDDE